jgi:hypothetical protein
MEGDGIYFGRRANEERVAAMKAAHPRARNAHLEMADRYHDLAVAIEEREHVLGQKLNGAA